MHGNMRPIWGNFEDRWIFQVALIKKGLYKTFLNKTKILNFCIEMFFSFWCHYFMK